MTIVYKIQSNIDGTYSKGGWFPEFNTKGKVWRRMEDVSNHLQQLDQRGREAYQQADAHVVKIQISENPLDTYSMSDWIRGMKERRQRRLSTKEDRQARAEIARKQEEIRVLSERLRQLKAGLP